MIKFKINSRYIGQRVDRVISSEYSVGYGTLQKLFRQGKISINGRKNISSNYRCQAEDEVCIFFEIMKKENNAISPEVKQQRLDILRSMIVFENDACFVINKPSGLAVQKGSKISFSVEDLIKSYSDFDCKLVHRLDKDTSGALVVAKSLDAARAITTAFKYGQAKKKYVAILDGVPGLLKGHIENYLKKTVISNEEKVVVCSKTDDHANLAKTNYIVKHANGRSCFVELYPETGRTHQLRVHCYEVLKAPILGDKKYFIRKIKEKYMYLHAQRITIPSLKIDIELPLPDYFELKMQNMVEVNNQAHLAYISSLKL